MYSPLPLPDPNSDPALIALFVFFVATSLPIRVIRGHFGSALIDPCHVKFLTFLPISARLYGAWCDGPLATVLLRCGRWYFRNFLFSGGTGMNAHRRSRLLRGFTLVELLVVIAIIGVLVSLLLPAVQSAREAARRMQCTNNLHNLALACHNYHDSLGSFPNSHFCTPVTPGGAACVANEESWGWQVLILPYVEQKPLYDQLGVLNYGLDDVLAKKNPSLPDPRSMLQTKLSIYICPSDSNPADPVSSADRHFGGGLGTTAGGLGNFQPGVCNYMSNRGTRNNHHPGSTNQDTHGMFMEGSASVFKM